MTPRITVVGSVNIDLVARCSRLPAPGETIGGAEFRRIPGGKGANQAVAAARLGAQVRFVGRVGADRFALLSADDQLEVVHDFDNGRLHGGVWDTLNVSRAWSVVTRHLSQQFYAHPWAWNEIGFGGPAYPRGYSRFGSPHLQGAEREEWEGREAYEREPVRDTQERGLE